MDDFLDNYEVLGGKLKPVLPGETPTEKLAVLRQSLREEHFNSKDDLEMNVMDRAELFEEDDEERWDCETILSMLSCIVTVVR